VCRCNLCHIIIIRIIYVSLLNSVVIPSGVFRIFRKVVDLRETFPFPSTPRILILMWLNISVLHEVKWKITALRRNGLCKCETTRVPILLPQRASGMKNAMSPKTGFSVLNGIRMKIEWALFVSRKQRKRGILSPSILSRRSIEYYIMYSATTGNADVTSPFDSRSRKRFWAWKNRYYH